MLNKVTLIGNLGGDPTVNLTQKGESVASFTLATSESWKDSASGEQKTATEWHRLVCYNRQAEIASDYLKKGQQVYVEGKLRTRKWEKDGVTHYTTEIVVSQIRMLGSRNAGADQGGATPDGETIE